MLSRFQHAKAARPCGQRTPRVRAARRPLVVVSFKGATAPPMTPSSAAAANELDCLSRVTTVVPDLLALEGAGAAPGRPKAATVSSAILRAVLASESLGMKPYENAITAALTYEQCRSAPSASARASCALDKALANVGALLLGAGGVEGRVATEVDPRLARDTGALVGKAHSLLALYRELGVSSDRLIFRLPATWEGTQAARKLEGEGLATQVFLVYSMVQGVAAMQAGASVVQPNVGRLRDWYGSHPGAIRNPHGPREDSGALSSYDPGLELAKGLYCYARRFHRHSKVMASGIRTRADALALSGIDYMVVGAKVLGQLEGQATDMGYNDGLSAMAGGGVGLEAALSPQVAEASDVMQLEPVTQASWQSGLGLAATELLSAGLSGQVADVEGLLALLQERAGGME